MAGDSSQNPGAQAQFEELQRRLAGLEGEFSQQLAGIANATARVEGAAGDLELVVRKKLAEKPGGVQEPAQIRESTASMEALAAAEQRATTAAQERIALETRESALLNEITAAQQRLAAATTESSAADIARTQAGATYRTTSRQAAAGKVPAADAEAALQAQQAERARAQVARQELGASQRTLSSLQSELGAVQSSLETQRALEGAIGDELSAAREAAALYAQVAAAVGQQLALVRQSVASYQTGQPFFGRSVGSSLASYQMGGATGPGIRGGGYMMGEGMLPPGGPPRGPGGPLEMPPSRPPWWSSLGTYQQGAGTETAAMMQQRNAPWWASTGNYQGGGGSEPPPKPPRQPISLREVQTPEELSRAAAQTTQLSAASRGLGAGMEYEARTMSIASQALTRHGELSSEMLAQLRAGQMGLQDFGGAMSGVISKFAGWTAAAAAVYGVFSVVQKVGAGALEGTSGVGQLQRTIETLDTGRAAQQIRSLSEDTVTPLKEASDAVFAFSRTFHDQNDAVYAARLALMAYKLDGVAVTDQVRAMTAINRQFGVSAQGMGAVYGLLAEGQRQFNARVNEMIPALMNSASQIHNAGGDLTDYIKILQLALVTTQLSGAQLATAFRRSPGFIQTPKSEQMLRALGFDPASALSDYTGFIKEALAKSRSWSDQQRRDFLAAAFGKQQGPRIAGLFNPQVDPKLRADILGQSVKDASPLMQEFAKWFDVPVNRIHELSVQLEVLGSNLASSGLLSGLGVMVSLLNETLRVANMLLSTFQALPGPVRDALGLLMAMRVGAGVIGHFPGAVGQGGVAGAITSVGYGLNPQKAEGAALMKTLEDEKREYTNMREQSAARRFALQRSIEASTSTVATLRASGASEEQIADEEKRIEQQQTAMKVAVAEHAKANNLLLQSERQIADAKMMLGQGYTAQSTAKVIGAQYMTPLGRPGAGGAEPIPIPIGQPPGPEPVPGPDLARQIEQRTKQSELLGAEAENETAALERMSVGERLTAARVGATAAAGSLAASAGRMMVGLMNPWMLALFVLPEVFGAIKAAWDEFDRTTREINALMTAPPNLSNAQKLTAAIAKKGHEEHQMLYQAKQKWHDGVKWIGDRLNELADTVAEISGDKVATTTPTGSDPFAAGNLEQSAGAVPPQQLLALMRQKGMNRDDITARLRQAIDAQDQQTAKDATRIAAGSKTGPDLKANLDNLKTIAENDPVLRALKLIDPASAAQEIQSIDNAIQSAWQKRVDALRQVQTPSGKPLTPMQHLIAQGQASGGLDQQLKDLQALADHMKLYGASNADLQKMADLYTVITAESANSKDPAVLQKVTQGQSEFTGAITTRVQALQQQANAIIVPTVKAAGMAAHLAALKKKEDLFKQASALLKTLLSMAGVSVDSFANAIGATDQNLRDAQNMVDLINSMIAAGVGQAVYTLTQLPAFAGGKAVKSDTSFQDFKQAAERWAKKVEGQTNQTKAAADAQNALDGQMAQLGQSLTKQAGSAAGAGAGAGTTDPVELARLRREINKARMEGDPVAQAQQDIAGALEEKRLAKTTRDQLQAELDYQNAENELKQARDDLAQARYKYLESLTTDPLKIDQLEIEATAKAVAATKPGTTGRYNALAAANAAKQKLIDDRVQSRDQDIQFALSMNDITTQQAEQDIAALLRIKNLSVDTRKRLRQELEQLKKGSQDSFSDLNLGSIRLPTPYEIRRSILSIRDQGVAAAVQQNTQIVLNVHNASDVPAVGVVLERHLGGPGKSAARAAGRRG